MAAFIQQHELRLLLATHVIFQKFPSRARVAQKVLSSIRVAGTRWSLGIAHFGRRGLKTLRQLYRNNCLQ